MITNDLLSFSIEKEYKDALHWVNFWVGFKNINGDGVQVVDSTIVEWDLPYDKPSDLVSLTDKWRSDFSRHKEMEAIPKSISMRQARLMLNREGLLASVQSSIDKIPEPMRSEAQIEWDFAQTVHRENPVMKMLAQVLELSDERLDEMFIEASKL